MPIYEFKCKDCGHCFDYFAERIDETPGECPQCNAPGPEKQISAFNPGKGEVSSDESPCANGACATGGCPANSCPM